MQVLERRTAQLELARRLEADVPVGTAQRNDIAVLDDWLPAEFSQPLEKVADPAGLVVGGRSAVGDSVNELLVLGADAPAVLRLFAAPEQRQQVGSAIDLTRIAVVGARGHGRRALAAAMRSRQRFRLMSQ